MRSPRRPILAAVLHQRARLFHPAIICLAGAAGALAEPMPPPRLLPGAPMPPFEFRLLGARLDAPKWRLADLKGSRPVLMIYWLAGSARSAELFGESRGVLDDLLAGGVEVVSVTAIKPPMTEEQILSSAREMKLDVPVLLDEDLTFSSLFGIDSVPALTFVDKEGTVRVIDARHFSHEVESGTSFETYLRRGLRAGVWPTVETMPRYNTGDELVGRSYIDFTLPDLITLKPKSLSAMVSSGRWNVLIFWSITCPPCERMIPKLARWYDSVGKGKVGVISVATATGESARADTARFMYEEQVHFPVLMDHALELKPVYRIASTPAVFLIGPDGRIEAAASGADADVPKLLSERGVLAAETTEKGAKATPGAEAPKAQKQEGAEIPTSETNQDSAGSPDEKRRSKREARTGGVTIDDTPKSQENRPSA